MEGLTPAFEGYAVESAGDNLLAFAGAEKFGTVLADSPWRFSNRTGKMAPEHRRLARYSTMDLDEIMEMPAQVRLLETREDFG